jgi:hypothetical protein
MGLVSQEHVLFNDTICYGSAGLSSTARLTRRRDQNVGNRVEYFDYLIHRGDEHSPRPKS